jgi:hypothetical protein
MKPSDAMDWMEERGYDDDSYSFKAVACILALFATERERAMEAGYEEEE